MPTALVTGASQGIGLEFVRQLSVSWCKQPIYVENVLSRCPGILAVGGWSFSLHHEAGPSSRHAAPRTRPQSSWRCRSLHAHARTHGWRADDGTRCPPARRPRMRILMVMTKRPHVCTCARDQCRPATRASRSNSWT